MTVEKTISKERTSSVEKIASGKRVNKASDEASSVSISNRMASYIKSTSKAFGNVQHAINILETAENALAQINDKLIQIKNLLIMSESETNHDTYTNHGYNSFSKEERERLIAEIKEIGENANFNGFKVTSNEPFGYSNNWQYDSDGKTIYNNDHFLDAQKMATMEYGYSNTYKPAYVFQTSPEAAKRDMIDGNIQHNVFEVQMIALSRYNFPTYNISSYDFTTNARYTESLSQPGLGIHFLDNPYHGAGDSLFDNIDYSIEHISFWRTLTASNINRLESQGRQLTNMNTGLSSSLDRFTDTDFAATTSALVKNQILEEAAISLHAQANANKETVLALIER